ncbi:MAG: AAA family ATPase [Nitrospinales bacterium]
MYESFYGLKEKPFSLTPDPKFIYLSKHHQGALDHMLYGIRQKEGFMTIVGDVGTGKTTLCRCLLDRLDDSVQVALILNPMVSDIDLLRTCLHDLGVRPVHAGRKLVAAVPAGDASAEQDAGPAEDSAEDFSWINTLSKKELLDTLNAFLLQQHREGKSTVLIIDEAQNLSLDVLEQLRILSNLETEKDKLLQIIFVGQLELNDKLALPELKQLNQRISIRYRIAPLSREETRRYITHRLMVAGANAGIRFTRSSLNAVYNYSRGYPRLINLSCDRALLAGFNAQVDTIDAGHVKRGIRSLHDSDETGGWLRRVFMDRLSLAASILFFLAGLAFFMMGGNDPAGGKTADLSPRLKTPDTAPAPAQQPPVAATVAAQTEPADNYRIQVYALSQQNLAEKNVRQLREEGYVAYWKKIESSGHTWFVVYVGPFQNIESAKTRLALLRQSGRESILLSVPKTGRKARP